MTISSITALFGTMLVLAVAPGPSDFAVVARAIASGFTQSLFMISGIVIADILFIVLAVWTLAEVAQSMEGLFRWVTYLCGLYLIWLGVSSIRSQPRAEDLQKARSSSAYSSFVGGMLITFSDPKAILFYMGLFPAFLDLPNITVSDTVVIMLIATVVVGGVKTGYAYLAEKAKLVLRETKIKRRLDLAAGAVLICVGLFIVFLR